MKIIGYSERGAMNALFYGMALKNDVVGMRSFLELAGIIDSGYYDNFELFIEFSLSEFGSPDLVIFATNKNNQREVFFIEAKASCCKEYKLKDQKEWHDNYVESGTEHVDGHASNLFFQLRLKNYFWQLRKWFCEGMKPPRPSVEFQDDKKELIKRTKGHDRGIGNNPVVHNFVNEFGENKGTCVQAHYIAIIPQQPKGTNVKVDYDFPIHFMTWEKIKEKFYDKEGYEFLKDTFDFNKGKQKQNSKKNKSQILNNPLPDDE